MANHEKIYSLLHTGESRWLQCSAFQKDKSRSGSKTGHLIMYQVLFINSHGFHNSGSKTGYTKINVKNFFKINIMVLKKVLL